MVQFVPGISSPGQYRILVNLGDISLQCEASVSSDGTPKRGPCDPFFGEVVLAERREESGTSVRPYATHIAGVQWEKVSSYATIEVTKDGTVIQSRIVDLHRESSECPESMFMVGEFPL